jgi:hypothetical protein
MHSSDIGSRTHASAEQGLYSASNTHADGVTVTVAAVSKASSDATQSLNTPTLSGRNSTTTWLSVWDTVIFE